MSAAVQSYVGPTSSHPCGQPWHPSANVDISQLIKNEDGESPQRPYSPQPSTRSNSSFSNAASSSKRPLITTSILPAKRPARATELLPCESPAKKQSKWSAEEDAKIIQLRGEGMKWEDISKHLPGRSAISCRLHYQNYLERRSEWDEDRKNKLARLYERFKADMWAKIAEEMAIPWRAAEAMHWQMGEVEMARRAGVTPFTLANTNNSNSSQSQSATRPAGRTSTLRTPSDSDFRTNQQQLPSLAELTAGLPAYSQPNPTHLYADTTRTPVTSYSHSTLPHPKQTLTPPPGNLQKPDYFAQRH